MSRASRRYRVSMGLRLPPELKKDLQEWARKDHRSLSNLVKNWLYETLERKTGKTSTQREND